MSIFSKFQKKLYIVLYKLRNLLKRYFKKILKSRRKNLNSFDGYPLCRVSKKSVFGGYSEKMQKHKFSKSWFIILYVRLVRTYNYILIYILIYISRCQPFLSKNLLFSLSSKRNYISIIHIQKPLEVLYIFRNLWKSSFKISMYVCKFVCMHV